jgi:hypothetical protein
MRSHAVLWLIPALMLAAVVGCGGGSNKTSPAKAPQTAEKKDAEAEIEANLAKLTPEDRKLARAQRYCAVENKNRLGSMGVPMKIVIQDEPVFLCCDSCETRARAHADRTLAKVREFKERTATEGDKW